MIKTGSFRACFFDSLFHAQQKTLLSNLSREMEQVMQKKFKALKVVYSITYLIDNIRNVNNLHNHS
jgi:hypothetical protein